MVKRSLALVRRCGSRGSWPTLSGLACFAASAVLGAQGGTVGGAVSGAGDLALLHFANSSLGPFATGGGAAAGLRAVEGQLDVVDHEGQRVLRASSRSTLRLSLPSTLPRDFTVEIDLVPKECCQPEDIAIEGTPTINQGPFSANILWKRESIQIVGGGNSFDRPMPDAIAATLPGALTNIMITFRGDELTVYTNGELIYTVPDRKFVRGRVLRIFLGGQNDSDRAVYLARLRVAAGVGTPTAAGATSTGTTAPPPPAGAVPPPPVAGQPGGASAPSSAPSAPTAMPSFAGNVQVTPGPNGPLVTWSPAGGRAAYQVVRWKVDDPLCCVASSPAGPAMSASSWQDSPPAMPGTYAYQVTAFTSGGPFVAQGQFVYQGSGGQTSSAPSVGGQPPAIQSAPSNPMVNVPAGGRGGSVPAGLTVSVAMGANGPVVSWNTVAGATGYRVARAKADDAQCCNSSSGASPLPGGPWQDQAPPASGTYVYTVTASTAGGALQGTAQFAYSAPLTAAPVGPVTGTATPMPASSSGGGAGQAAGGAGQPSGGPGAPTGTGGPANPANDPCTAPKGSSGGSNTMAPTSQSGGGLASPCTGRYRVTLTGFHAIVPTLEPSPSLDGTGDEVYAAAAAILYNPTAMTVGARGIVKSREYGDKGTSGMWPNRIQAGSMSATGGIWTGNGPEQVPSHYVPNGSTIPAPGADQFPMLVWEGSLTDGTAALLVVPTLWERDLDTSIYAIWDRYWRSSALAPLFSNAAVSQAISTPTLAQLTNPLKTLGTPLDVPLADMAGSLRDHPIGTVPSPAGAPIVGRYDDRLIILTRQKLAHLTPGTAQTLPIPLVEPTTIFSKGHYTLYLRIERLQ